MMVLPNFFVIEGLDGSGKTTLARTLVQTLGAKAKYTMEPTHEGKGAMIRDILEHRKPTPSPLEFLDLFIEDRREHQSWIKEHVDRGEIVVLDRYVLSTLVYQRMHFSLDDLWEKNKAFFIPQKTFFLSIPADIAFERKKRQVAEKAKLHLFEVRDIQDKVSLYYEESIPFLEKQGYTVMKFDGKLPTEALVEQCIKEMREEISL